jgi:hypothetical protein
MTAELDDMPFGSAAGDPVVVIPPTPRRGRVSLVHEVDPLIVRRNRGNKNRGKATSRELASYLGWQNVEGMLWPWDVQGPGGRLQSKRDARGRSRTMVLALIEAITPGDWLRGVFIVAPRQRLASGTVTLLLEEWVAWHGWKLPADAVLVNAGRPLLSLPLATFRDWRAGEAKP